jgi:protein-S-isoprenylcysteine O-methyltransferase Ste14
MNTGTGGEPSDGSPVDVESAASQFGRGLDDLAHRLDQRDWVELAATVVLSLAVLVATWSAYQAALWGGVQASNASLYTGQLTESNDLTSLITAQFESDSQAISTWLIMAAEDNERGMQILEERFDDTLRPAFDAWIAGSIDGDVPPGLPQDLPEYEAGFDELLEAKNFLFASATEARETAGEANRTSDSFVLVTVIMASVMFFAGIGTKLRGQATRITMLVVAVLLCAGAIAAMLTLPQQPVSF